jgi:mRNA-degrading endonuclease RelE of RelBE toxin-antitoxin system
MTVAELPADADRILGEQSHRQLIEYLGLHPEARLVIPDTSGVRKLRWIAPGRGKRGGARVIYYFHNENLPILALAIYAKNEKVDVNTKDKKQMKAAVHEYLKSHTGGKR